MSFLLSHHATIRVAERANIEPCQALKLLNESNSVFLGSDRNTGASARIAFSTQHRCHFIAVVAPDAPLVVTVLSLEQGKRSPWARALSPEKLVKAAELAGAPPLDALLSSQNEIGLVPARLRVSLLSNSLQYKKGNAGIVNVPAAWFSFLRRELTDDAISTEIVTLVRGVLSKHPEHAHLDAISLHLYGYVIDLSSRALNFVDADTLRMSARWRAASPCNLAAAA